MRGAFRGILHALLPGVPLSLRDHGVHSMERPGQVGLEMGEEPVDWVSIFCSDLFAVSLLTIAIITRFDCLKRVFCRSQEKMKNIKKCVSGLTDKIRKKVS